MSRRYYRSGLFDGVNPHPERRLSKFGMVVGGALAIYTLKIWAPFVVLALLMVGVRGLWRKVMFK